MQVLSPPTAAQETRALPRMGGNDRAMKTQQQEEDQEHEDGGEEGNPNWFAPSTRATQDEAAVVSFSPLKNPSGSISPPVSPDFGGRGAKEEELLSARFSRVPGDSDAAVSSTPAPSGPLFHCAESPARAQTPEEDLAIRQEVDDAPRLPGGHVAAAAPPDHAPAPLVSARFADASGDPPAASEKMRDGAIRREVEQAFLALVGRDPSEVREGLLQIWTTFAAEHGVELMRGALSGTPQAVAWREQQQQQPQEQQHQQQQQQPQEQQQQQQQGQHDAQRSVHTSTPTAPSFPTAAGQVSPSNARRAKGSKRRKVKENDMPAQGSWVLAEAAAWVLDQHSPPSKRSRKKSRTKKTHSKRARTLSSARRTAASGQFDTLVVSGSDSSSTLSSSSTSATSSWSSSSSSSSRSSDSDPDAQHPALVGEGRREGVFFSDSGGDDFVRIKVSDLQRILSPSAEVHARLGLGEDEETLEADEDVGEDPSAKGALAADRRLLKEMGIGVGHVLSAKRKGSDLPRQRQLKRARAESLSAKGKPAKTPTPRSSAVAVVPGQRVKKRTPPKKPKAVKGRPTPKQRVSHATNQAASKSLREKRLAPSSVPALDLQDILVGAPKGTNGLGASFLPFAVYVMQHNPEHLHWTPTQIVERARKMGGVPIPAGATPQNSVSRTLTTQRYSPAPILKQHNGWALAPWLHIGAPATESYHSWMGFHNFS